MSLLHRNIASLMAWQISTYLLPLITFPYMTRVLGPDGFGLLGFSQGIIAYAVLLTDWGFGISASQQIARQQKNAAEISRIFWETMYAKGVLMMISLLLLLISLLCLPSLRANAGVLLIMWLLVPGSMLTPSWLLQGLERMGSFATLSILGRLCAIPLVFWLIKKPDDVFWAALIQVSATVISALASLVVVYRLGVVRWHSPSLQGALSQIRRGYNVFIASAAINIYTASNTVILGAMAGVRDVGYFAGADKLRTAAQGLLNPLSMAVFPRANAVMAESEERGLAFLRKVLVIQGGLGFCISLGLWAAARWLVVLVLGGDYADAAIVLQWLALIPAMIALNNVFGMQVMLALGRQKAFTRILLCSSLLNMILIFPLVNWYGAKGAALTMAAVESFVTIAMALYIHLTGIPLFRWRSSN